MSWLWIALAALVAALMLMLGHWFPWRMAIGRDLPRLAAYVYGTLSILVPFSVLLYVAGQMMLLAGLWIIVGVAGLADMVCWEADEIWRKIRKADELEDLLENCDEKE